MRVMLICFKVTVPIVSEFRRMPDESSGKVRLSKLTITPALLGEFLIVKYGPDDNELGPVIVVSPLILTSCVICVLKWVSNV